MEIRSKKRATLSALRRKGVSQPQSQSRKQKAHEATTAMNWLEVKAEQTSPIEASAIASNERPKKTESRC